MRLSSQLITSYKNTQYFFFPSEQFFMHCIIFSAQDSWLCCLHFNDGGLDVEADVLSTKGFHRRYFIWSFPPTLQGRKGARPPISLGEVEVSLGRHPTKQAGLGPRCEIR